MVRMEIKDRVRGAFSWFRGFLPISRRCATRGIGDAQSMWHKLCVRPEIDESRQQIYEQISRNADALRVALDVHRKMVGGHVQALKSGKANAQTVGALVRRIERLEDALKASKAAKRKGNA